MSKLGVKDIMMFLKVFGISSLFFVSGIIICLVGHTHLKIGWPAYVIISAMLIGAGIVVLIIETIRSIYVKNKNIDKDLDVLKDYLDDHGYLSWIEEQNKGIGKGVKKDEKNL